MVSQESVNEQLKRINFKSHGWGRGELSELPHILLEGEEIHECVNGLYEGGFALLVATDVRVLLIDKKPLNYLTVEDLRFDMINEMDYNHRLMGADISISAGNKVLKFRSYNQHRLRKLIGHVQHSMAETKKKQSTHQEGQNHHLREINEQLRDYLIAQQQYQLQLQQSQLGNSAPPAAPPSEPKPGPELSDYLYAQSLLDRYQKETGRSDLPVQAELLDQIKATSQPLPQLQTGSGTATDTDTGVSRQPAQATPQLPGNSDREEIYLEGLREVFGQNKHAIPPIQASPNHSLLEISPMRIAYSKLPMALRNRKFGRPSFHAHSRQADYLTSSRRTWPAEA